MDMTFAPLMARASDEPDAMYGLAAKSVQISPDKLTYRFTLRPEARFHDGSKLTAHDAAFSLTTLKAKGHPLIVHAVARHGEGAKRPTTRRWSSPSPKSARATCRSMSRACRSSRRPITRRGRSTNRRSISRWARGRTRSASSRSTATSNSSGSRIGGAPIFRSTRGSYNFDIVRYEFYRDRDVAFEGFTGKNYLFREEFTARIWATRYDFPAVKDGRVKRETLPDETPSGAQGWFINTRRDKFKDPRVREALIQAFDFEWTNKTIMYGAYARTHSPFQNSDMMANGPPSPEELKLLEPFRGQVPDEVFGDAVRAAGVGRLGAGPDAAAQGVSNCCRTPGCVIKDGKRLLPNGEVFKIEFLLDEPSFQPHHAPFIKNLGTLGIEASLRLVDAVQYRARVEDFDFDMTIERFSMSATPGDGMRPFFSSQAAATKGSYNLAGIANPAIDALIEKIIGADTRADLTIACRAFDRVFRAGRYWVPQWYRTTHPIAYWDLFGHPAKPPRYAQGVGAPENWWSDAAKAAKARAGEIIHERLYRPPHSADDPDAARDPVRLLRRGAVRAGRAGRARDRAALRRRHRRHLADFRRVRRRFRRARPGRRVQPMPSVRNTAARRGSIPISSRAWKSSSASTSRRRNASR